MDLKPIRTKRIYVRIVEQIKQLFASGDLRPGDKLPSERDLAERLQVSRASVREALSALEAMGLLEIRPGEGAFIRQISVDSIIEPLALLLLMEKDKTWELLEVRKMMEIKTAGLAALRAAPEELERLNKILTRMESDLQRGELGEEADWDFHFTIAEMAGNSILLRLMNTIGDVMRQGLKTARLELYVKPGNAQLLYEQHRAISQAIEKKDSEKAQQAMREHLIFVEQELLGPSGPHKDLA
jgi:GntR family transcriptional repressor for pyruvate dehydrogenase complex